MALPQNGCSIGLPILPSRISSSLLMERASEGTALIEATKRSESSEDAICAPMRPALDWECDGKR